MLETTPSKALLTCWGSTPCVHFTSRPALIQTGGSAVYNIYSLALWRECVPPLRQESTEEDEGESWKVSKL